MLFHRLSVFQRKPLNQSRLSKYPLFTCFYPAVSADNSSRFNIYHIDRQIPFPIRCSACYSHSQWLCVIFPDSHHLLVTGDGMKGALSWRKQQQQTQWAQAPPRQLRHFLLKRIFVEGTPRHFTATCHAWPDGRHDSVYGSGICGVTATAEIIRALIVEVRQCSCQNQKCFNVETNRSRSLKCK